GGVRPGGGCGRQRDETQRHKGTKIREEEEGRKRGKENTKGNLVLIAIAPGLPLRAVTVRPPTVPLLVLTLPLSSSLLLLLLLLLLLPFVPLCLCVFFVLAHEC